MIDLIFSGQIYLFLIVFVMMIAGMIKDNNLFSDVFSFLKRSMKSNRAIVALFSALTGILPIKGRVTVSAGLLDTMAPKKPASRSKFGPIDFMATHHYYFWSPLEKTVILPMAAFGLSYGAFIGIIWPLLAMTFVYTLSYLIFFVKDTDIKLKRGEDEIKISRITRYVFPYILGLIAVISGVNFLFAFGSLTIYYMIVTRTFDIKKLLRYVDWTIVAWVAGIIFLSNIVTGHTNEITTFLGTTGLDITTTFGFVAISLLSFIGAFALGSSSRFGAITVLLASIYGIEYLPWFFAVDFAGYVLSPMHKCVAIGKMYFGTKLSTYVKILSGWAVLLIATSGVLLWI
jgi:uncharacterized protein|tara:strand:+ start:204 stop:1235 length:1032 start_codon:yes stop_codon:yes gene_type:complete